VDYSPGSCPVIERLYYKELMCTDVCHAQTTESDLLDVVSAFEKIYDNIGELHARP
jgi:hypothetical protein